jgi:hypothetical protein
MIVIGVDVHKRSLTAAACRPDGRLWPRQTLRAARMGCGVGGRA